MNKRIPNISSKSITKWTDIESFLKAINDNLLAISWAGNRIHNNSNKIEQTGSKQSFLAAHRQPRGFGLGVHHYQMASNGALMDVDGHEWTIISIELLSIAIIAHQIIIQSSLTAIAKNTTWFQQNLKNGLDAIFVNPNLVPLQPHWMEMLCGSGVGNSNETRLDLMLN